MLGLDIDDKSIKLVELRETPRGYSLVNYAIEPGPPTSKAIQKILKSLAIEEKEVYGVLSGKNVVLYPKLLPVMGDRELREAVFWETKELISFPIEEAIITYDKTGERVEAGIKKLDVILVVIRREYFKKIQELLEEAGLKVKGLTPAPFALWDLVKLKYKPKKEEIFAILDIGSISASFNLFVGSDLKFTREISALETFSSEVLQTINYIYEKGIASHIDLLLLAGEVSKLENLDNLAKNLGIKTEVFNPLKDIEIQEPSSELEASSPRLAVALGLALGKTQSLNVLKIVRAGEERTFPKIPFKTLVSAGVSLILIISLLFSVNLFFRSFKDNLKKNLSLKTAELKLKQKPKIPEVAKENNVKAILDELFEFLPSAFTLEDLDYERGKKSVTFSGTLSKQEILGTLIYNLQASGKYKEVKLWKVEKKGDLVRAEIGLALQK